MRGTCHWCRHIIDILRVAFVIGVVIWRRGNATILLNAITIDSLFSSVDMFIPTSHPHNIPIMHRYVHYFCMWLMHLYLTALLWGMSDELYWLCMCLTIPQILNITLAQQEFIYIYTCIMRPIVGLFMTSVSGIAAWILNSVCKSIIGTDPKISRSEVQLLMESGYDEMIAFIKSILIAALIKYMEGGRPAYGWIISQLYKRGYMIKPVTADPVIAEDATARIRIIVHDRKWNQLCNPLILKDVLYLYGGAPSDLSETIAKYITYYDASLARFFALYSIIALFNQPLVLFPLSMLLIRRPTVPGAIARVVGGVLSYAYPDTLLICAVSELGECLYGSGTIWLFRQIGRAHV